MIFTFFITIVFIAELIIAFTIFINLVKIDKLILETNDTLNIAKPEIKGLVELARKISEQLKELAPIWVENFNDERDKIIIKQLKSVFAGLLLWKMNFKLIKKIRKSKLLKTAWKGFTLLQNMV